LVARWVPGRPRRQSGLRSLMRFGGTMTLNGLVVYIASNFDKVLLGRFWGAEAIGLYGRAYQLIRIPTDNLNGAIGEVAFAALSRIQNDNDRLKRYFLKGYSLVLAVTLPITVACALLPTTSWSFYWVKSGKMLPQSFGCCRRRSWSLPLPILWDGCSIR